MTSIRIDLFADVRVSTEGGRLITPSSQRRALLAALALADRPVSRDELQAAIGVSRRTLAPMLARIATDDLGLARQFHRPVGSRRRLIELDPDVVTTDVAELRLLLLSDDDDERRLQRIASSGVLSHGGELGLVKGASLTAELLDELQALRDRAASQLAGHDPAGDRAGHFGELEAEWLGDGDRRPAGEALRLAGLVPTEPDSAGGPQTVLAIAAMAADRDGRVHLSLANHLFELVGGRRPLTVADAVEAARSAALDGVDGVDGLDDVDGTQGIEGAEGIDGLVAVTLDPAGIILDPTLVSVLEVHDRRLLADAAIRWLMRHPCPDDLALSVLERLVALPDIGRLPPGLAPALTEQAGLLARRGNPEAAGRAIDLALTTATSPPERAPILASRGDLRQDQGQRDLACRDYRQAIELLPERPDQLPQVADLVLRMARLSWDHERGREVDALLRSCRRDMPPGEALLAARIDLCLAGGSYQDGATGTTRIPEARIRQALGAVQASIGRRTRAWGLIHARKSLLGVAPVSESLSWAEAIVDNAGPDVVLAAHGHLARFVDHVRAGSWAEARLARDDLGRLAAAGVPAEQEFSAIVTRTCWDLADGDFAAVANGLAREQGYRSILAGSTFDQIVLAHTIWLTRNSGDRVAVRDLAAAAATAAASEPRGEIWTAGAALLATDLGQHDDAVTRLESFARQGGGFDGLERGPHRLPLLAVAAHVAAHAASKSTAGLGRHDLEALLASLTAVDDRVVLVGWPTIVLGPVDHFRALVLATLGRHDEAAEALASAATIAQPMTALAREIELSAGLIGGLASAGASRGATRPGG